MANRVTIPLPETFGRALLNITAIAAHQIPTASDNLAIKTARCLGSVVRFLGARDLVTTCAHQLNQYDIQELTRLQNKSNPTNPRPGIPLIAAPAAFIFRGNPIDTIIIDCDNIDHPESRWACVASGLRTYRSAQGITVTKLTFVTSTSAHFSTLDFLWEDQGFVPLLLLADITEISFQGFAHPPTEIGGRTRWPPELKHLFQKNPNLTTVRFRSDSQADIIASRHTYDVLTTQMLDAVTYGMLRGSIAGDANVIPICSSNPQSLEQAYELLKNGSPSDYYIELTIDNALGPAAIQSVRDLIHKQSSDLFQGSLQSIVIYVVGNPTATDLENYLPYFWELFPHTYADMTCLPDYFSILGENFRLRLRPTMVLLEQGPTVSAKISTPNQQGVLTYPPADLQEIIVEFREHGELPEGILPAHPLGQIIQSLA